MDVLVTLTGECFQSDFKREEVAADRDGVYFIFRLKDLSNKARGDFSLTLFSPGMVSIPDYKARIEGVRLNAMRRAFDDGTISFDHEHDTQSFQMLSLKAAAFKAPSAADDGKIRRYITHKAYWLGYRHGSAANKLFLQFDVPLDLDYLGVSSDDIKRNIWLLQEQGLLQKTEIPGVSIPTAKLIAQYEDGDVSPVTKVEPPPSVTVHLDDLLGIPLHGQLNQDLLNLGASCREGFPACVLGIDLDNFKPVNDTFGHPAGNEVLKKIAGIITLICQGKGQLYRNGGDEFVVILPNHALAEATATAERIRKAVAEATFVVCTSQVTASVGVACFPDTTEKSSLLLEHSDEAMYEAKRAGGNRVATKRNPMPDGAAAPTIRPPLVRSETTARADAAALWMSLQQGCYPGFTFMIENRSDDEIAIESIALKHGSVHLCAPTKPSKPNEINLPPRTTKQVSSWTPPASPTATLRLMLPNLKNGEIVQIDIVLVGTILGAKRTFSQTILATVVYSNHIITQFGG